MFRIGWITARRRTIAVKDAGVLENRSVAVVRVIESTAYVFRARHSKRADR